MSSSKSKAAEDNIKSYDEAMRERALRDPALAASRAEIAKLQGALGDAEARIHLEKQKGSATQNLNADYADLFRANARYAVGFKAQVMAFTDGLYLKTFRLRHLHTTLHKRKYPPLYIIVALLIPLMVVVAIIAYPPYAFGLASWMGSSSGGLPNAYIFVLTLVIVALLAFLFTRRKSSGSSGEKA